MLQTVPQMMESIYGFDLGKHVQITNILCKFKKNDGIKYTDTEVDRECERNRERERKSV